MNSIQLSGQIRYTSNAQILQSKIFKQLMVEIIEEAEEKNTSLREFTHLFLRNGDVSETKERFDLDEISNLLIALTMNSIETIDGLPYYSFPKLNHKKELLVKFIEEVFSLWRTKQRFMFKHSVYTKNLKERIYKQMVLAETNEDFRNLVLRVYREILINISDKRLKILRQLPSGAQAGFMYDYPEVNEDVKFKNIDFLYDMKFIWNMIFEPPVIFNTRSNKRRGVFKVVDRPILDKVKLQNPDDWYVFPIHVCTQNIYVVVYKDYLALGSGLGNLFELASFDYISNSKVDGIYFLGMDKQWFEENPSGIEGLPDWNGTIYKEDNDGPYVALVGDDPSIDYFGYMKKVILTVANLNVIDDGRLPIHGAMAEIKLVNGKKANVLMMGDSGAGKSETLEALQAIKERVSEINILIDDMGSLDIDEKDNKVQSYGTETGAFVRLDDLPPGYAYGAMDRSIFMNPTEINSRVIVPYSNYDDIIQPTDIDYFFYVNNYENVESDGDELKFFDNPEDAIKVFSKGARMAKGTTAEKGLTTSYFSNPFGAIQRKEQHEKIVDKYMRKMMETGIKIGELKSQLGLNGFEKTGPEIAAKALLNLIDKEKEITE